jgi:hypothetical protein
MMLRVGGFRKFSKVRCIFLLTRNKIKICFACKQYEKLRVKKTLVNCANYVTDIVFII